MRIPVRSTLQTSCVLLVILSVLSVAGCSQISQGGTSRGNIDKRNSPSNDNDRSSEGQYVTVDGERVFVPNVYIDPRSELMRPEKVARDILRGRKIIAAGEAKTTFRSSAKGTEFAVSTIEFEEGEPQTLAEQVPYCRKRVRVFDDLIRQSGMPTNDSVSGAGTAMLIAMKILDMDDPLERSKSWQAKYRQHLLTSEAYQGRSDEEKQANYEIAAFFAVEGLNEMKRAAAARSASERDEASKKAKGYGEMVLGFLTKGWPGSPVESSVK